MNDRQRAENLLGIARETLIEELRPLLPESARYTLAMVANAMRIAAFELAACDSAARADLECLERLYEAPARQLSGDRLHEALAQHERRVIDDIRGGCFDRGDGRQRMLFEYLNQRVTARLRVSNPKRVRY